MAGTIHPQLLPSFRLEREAEEEDWKEPKTWVKGKDAPWKEFLRDRATCWDNRNSAPSPTYPDFKHRFTWDPSWLYSQPTPAWALEELGSLADPFHGAALSGHPCQETAQIGTILASLIACTRNKDLVRGTSIHNDVMQCGLLQKCAHALVIMYAKCGELGKAKDLLDSHKSSCDVVSWTALIAGYAREGHGQSALDCFEQMEREGILPDAVTYACLLKACAVIGAGAIDTGKQIHDDIARQGLLQKDIVLSIALVDMYAKCGAVSKARQVLDGMPFQNVVSWSALIAGYTQEGDAEQAFNCFEEMQRQGIRPNAVTYALILKACAMIGDRDKGKQVHDEVASQGLLQNNIVLGNAIVDMYAKCGAVSKARQVLIGLPSQDVVSWNALITGYAQEGDAAQALNCFEEMRCQGILPDAVTYVCILNACATIGAADKGKQIHEDIERQGLLQNNIVVGNALVDMYAKGGAVSKARQVFEGLPSRNVVSWNALIAGYVQKGDAEQALDSFEEMQYQGMLPDAVTYACILKACATIRASNKGEQIHNEIAARGLLQNNIVLGNALVDMYAKCGAMEKARQVLFKLPSRDVVSWSSLIAGYTQEGDAEQALNCFEEMQHEGILPNEVTCACVLNVCSHRGLVEEGQALFVNMSTKYKVNPDLGCYTCMVDLFGRAGHLEKAIGLIEDMRSSDYSTIWHCLLGACRKWADVKVGRWAFERAVKLDKSDGSAYVLMADIYATAGMRQKAENIEALRIRNRAWKQPGHSQWNNARIFTRGSSFQDRKDAQSKCIDALC